MAVKTDKLRKLKKILQDMGSVLVAYSGGVDSTFLLKIAKDVLGDKALAVTANSATYTKEELVFSMQMAKELGVRYKIIKTRELNDKKFVSNPVNRCYFCKKELFGRLKNMAQKLKINFVVDASNVSDKKDYRPGSIAKKELSVCSPLQEAGFSKEEIRVLSKKLGLKAWNKPALACLASRVPYGTNITPQILARINFAESYLRKIGFPSVRLRHYNGLCRIEVPKEDIPALAARRKQIVDRLKKIGYNYVTLDLEGYRTGSMNEIIRITPHLRVGNVRCCRRKSAE